MRLSQVKPVYAAQSQRPRKARKSQKIHENLLLAE